MAAPKALSKKSDIENLQGVQILRWYDHPLSPGQPLPSGSRLEEWDFTHIYRLPSQTIGVDVAEITAEVFTCTRNDADVNFSEGSSVLNCEADPLVNLVHLLFNPPLKAVGTHVTGHWTDGRKYKVSFIVVLADGSKHTPFVDAPEGIFSSRRDTAPFVGAQASPSNPIAELYCDIVSTGTRDVDSEADVAISDLYYVPN
jgi:hypothetical protein